MENVKIEKSELYPLDRWDVYEFCPMGTTARIIQEAEFPEQFDIEIHKIRILKSRFDTNNIYYVIYNLNNQDYQQRVITNKDLKNQLELFFTNYLEELKIADIKPCENNFKYLQEENALDKTLKITNQSFYEDLKIKEDPYHYITFDIDNPMKVYLDGKLMRSKQNLDFISRYFQWMGVKW